MMYKMPSSVQVLAKIAEQDKIAKQLSEKVTQFSSTTQMLAELEQELKQLVMKRVSRGEPYQVVKYAEEPVSQAKNDPTHGIFGASMAAAGQAQRVPPPFPLDDTLLQEMDEEPPKCKSLMDSFKAWRASACLFFTTIMQPRPASTDGIHPLAEDSIVGMVVDEKAPQELQRNKATLNALNISPTTPSSTAKPVNPDARPPSIGFKLLKRKVPAVASPVEAPTDKITTRQEDIAGFLNSSRPLSANFLQRYRLGKVVGEGGFGFVMTATRVMDGQKVAVKFINTENIPRSTWLPDLRSSTGGRVPPEISILQQLEHPNIIRYLDHVVEAKKYALLVMELHGDDALAVNYLHTNGIVHRDFKDENVVVDSNYNIRIIDFGSAAPIPKSQHAFFAQFQGTALYASPEIVRKEMYRGPEAEMWALGVLLYTMVVGGSPFHSDAEILEGTVMMPRGFHLESDKDYHGGCRHLIQRLLDCDPETRITIEEVLEHSWLKKEVEFYQTAYPSTSS
ncbi:hypothetical protein HDU77_000761 [Chytriomyces hyalinus]|nr:hypothetical protein HDU77_000761 [Chytriomyces hyalinus]